MDLELAFVAFWLHFGTILGTFWHPWGTLWASKFDHCDLLVSILGLWPPKVVPGPPFRYPPPPIFFTFWRLLGDILKINCRLLL